MKTLLNRLIRNKPIIFLDQLIYRIGEDGVFATGAQLTYFLILSIFPFIIVFLNILSYTTLVREDVLFEIIQYLPYETQSIIIEFVNDIITGSSQGLLSFAAIAGIWTASSGVKPVIKAINRAYDYEENRSYFRIKFVSILFTLALLILLTLVFITLVFGELLGRRLFSLIGRTDLFLILWTNLRSIITIVYMVFIFSLLYKYSPCIKNRRHIRLRDTLPGSLFSALGWVLTSILFSHYVNNFSRYTVTYGSVVGIIFLLIWLYISSIIVVVGGEINATIEFLKINGFRKNSNKSIIEKYLK